MPTTEHIHLPLYTDEDTPDLSTTGHYNHAMEIIDANIGELTNDLDDECEARVSGDNALDAKVSSETAAREAADNAINATLAAKADQSALNKEFADRKAADTALGSRIDNAEVEISANSADLTGIKGLTYGTGGQVFLENEDGSYTSPALVEIRHEISDLQVQGGGTEVNSIAPLVVDNAPTASTYKAIAVGEYAKASSNGAAIGYSAKADASSVAIGDTSNASGAAAVCIGDRSSCSIAGSRSVAIGQYSSANERDVVSVGSGSSAHAPQTRRIINVTDPTNAQDAATKNYVDTVVAGGGGGIDANTTFGDLTAGVTS